MQITNQKRMAAQLLKCGVNRVWIDHHHIDEIAQSVQKEDIRDHIERGWIKAKPVQGTSRARARMRQAQRAKGRQKGHGRRKGTANARTPRKEVWMKTIRAQRRTLRSLRDEASIDASTYRRYYRKAKGGSYRSVAHMRSQMEIEGVDLPGGEA